MHVMALPASGMALAIMAARVTALLALVMVSLAPALALGLVLAPLAPLALPALVLAGTRRKGWSRSGGSRTRCRVSSAGGSPASRGLWRRRRRDHDGRRVGSRRVVQHQLRRGDLRQGVA